MLSDLPEPCGVVTGDTHNLPAGTTSWRTDTWWRPPEAGPTPEQLERSSRNRMAAIERSNSKWAE